MMLSCGMTVDTREPKAREYSDDEEGKLLREFDIAVNDGAVTRAEIEQIVEALRKERERVKQERRDVLNKEIQDAKSRQAELEAELREGQEKIALEERVEQRSILLAEQEDQKRIALEEQQGQERIALEEQKGKEENAREVEATKNQLTDELQEAKREIEAKIQRKKENISKKISEFNEAIDEGVTHKQALALYKDTESKVYTAAKSELEKCIRKSELAQKRVKTLDRELSHLEQDLGEVDKLLDRLSDSRQVEEAIRQEDEMWEEYRAEQAKYTEKQEASKEEQIEEAMKYKRQEEKEREIRENRDAEDAVMAGYADGLNPEEEPIEQGTYEVPVKPQEPIKPETQKPTQSQRPTAIPKSQPKPSQTSKQWKVESVTFSIEGGMQPVYKAIISNGKEQREMTSTEVATLDTEFDSDEIKTLTYQKGIAKAERYYDKGLAQFLADIDAEHGTQSLKEYQTLLMNKERIYKCPEEFENYMKLNYDFSGLLVKPTAEMKKLQKIANANLIKGVVSEVKGRPNFLTRLMKRLFTKSLPEEVRIKMPRVQTSEKALDELEIQMQENLHPIQENRIMRDWANLHSTDGFDIEVFIEQVFGEDAKTSKEADEYRALQAEYEEGLKKDPQAIFRRRVKEEAEKGEPPVERKEEKEGSSIIVPPEDIRVLDEDGNEIGG